MIHKVYYKLENELNNKLINCRKNIKDIYNQISITSFASTPFNCKQNNKSRNNNNTNNIFYKKTSIFTEDNGYGTNTSQNKK